MVYLVINYCRCWIGKKHLDTAIKHLEDDFEFQISWKPFLLNPYMPDEGMPLREYCRLKFGDEAAERFLSGSSPVAQQGKRVVSHLNIRVSSD